MRLLSIVKITPEMRLVPASVGFVRQSRAKRSERKRMPFQYGKRDLWKEAGHCMKMMV
jgi:hypothetical protein